MSHIRVYKKHNLGKQGVRHTADKLADSLANEYRAVCSWQGDDLSFRSAGVNGMLHISHDEVVINVDLGLMLRPLKSKIESGIIGKLEEILAEENGAA